MTTIGFYPLDVTYRVVNDATQVYLFGRTTDNKQICVIDTKTKPSFYVVPRSNGEINDIITELTRMTVQKGNYTYKVLATKITEGVHGWRTVNAIKVFVNRPKALAGMREAVRKIAGVKTAYLDL